VILNGFKSHHPHDTLKYLEVFWGIFRNLFSYDGGSGGFSPEFGVLLNRETWDNVVVVSDVDVVVGHVGKTFPLLPIGQFGTPKGQHWSDGLNCTFKK